MSGTGDFASKNRLYERFYRTLEFPAIRALLAGFAGSVRGRQAMASLSPSTDESEVRASLLQCREAVALLRVAGRQPYNDLPEVEEAVGVARVAGAHLEPAELSQVASFLDGAREISVSVARVEEAPNLARSASRILDGTALAAAIRRAILPSGEVADNASPRLADIRRSLLRMRESLGSVMDSFLKDRDAARVLQDKVVTTRNDRFVLLIKAEHRQTLPGIVHGSSGSGASLFVEPMAAVELNNDIVARTEEERAEVIRILAQLTDGVRARAREMAEAFLILAELDALQAKALLAREMAASEPQVVGRGHELLLVDARHPMLMPNLRRRLAEGAAPSDAGASATRTNGPVPVTIGLGGEFPVLVISGPNTGGKTVALKTLGLSVLMAQSGLFIPAAAGSTLPVYASVFADIGDEQSIAANLSTFSAHLATIVAMLDGLALPSLVLLDEVGAGTDPTEGGALGVAIVAAFKERGATVAATTHHGLMKTWAQQTEGVACASFGYDPQTYAPTYVLQPGEAGRSLALEMAERLGLPHALVADARARVDKNQLEVDDLLKKLTAERASAAAEREQAQALRADAEMSLARQRLAEKEVAAARSGAAEAFAQELRRRSDEAARKAADAIRAAVQQLESSRKSTHAEAARARSAAVEAIRQAQQEAVADLPVAVPEREQELAGEPRVGDRVKLKELGVSGQVLDVSGAFVEVAVSGKRLKVRQADVTRLPAAPEKPRTVPVPSRVRQSAEEAAPEINLIGLTVDEALPRLDKLLDQAAMGDRDELRVIHGFGAGRLRAAVASLLEGHPHVASFREGRAHEGGGGATIVELK